MRSPPNAYDKISGKLHVYFEMLQYALFHEVLTLSQII